MTKRLPPHLHKKPPRPPLDEDLILSWADEHYQKYGVWPVSGLGRIEGHEGENWHTIDTSLRMGYRGLLPDSSLSNLLEDRRGVPNFLNRPKLTVEQILLWVDEYRTAHGRFPKLRDGNIEQAPPEKWRDVDNALRIGRRGLAGGASLARLLQEHRGTRNDKCLPNLSCDTILEWADDHFQRIGSWPTNNSGAVMAAPSERWSAVIAAVQHGVRGLPGGTTLPQLLLQHRGKKIGRDAPSFDIETITIWLQSYVARHGKYPRPITGAIEEAPGETWYKVDMALVKGHRGILEGGSSLAKLKQSLVQSRTLPDLADTALSVDLIADWIQAYVTLHKKFPSAESGDVECSPAENWQRIDSALRFGRRGLPAGSSLAGLKQTLILDGKLRGLKDKP